jgi:polyisoprenyl-phosphate glycosyltransferase
MNRPQLSLIIPIFNEESTIPELDRRLTAFLGKLEVVGGSWEVVFIDDGSRDRSSELLTALAARESRYKLVTFSRNFGHQIAITAGFDRAEGDAVAVLDADLQDPPEVVAEMLEKSRQGFDVVYGVRTKRKGETLFKRVTAAGYYRLMRAMTGADIPLDAGDFRLMTRVVVLTMRALREQHRFVRGMVAWVGFRQTAVYYDREPRFAGETKYSLKKMLRFAIDGITSFSIVPLRLATWLGLLGAVLAVLLGLAFLAMTFGGFGSVPSWSTLLVVMLFGFSAQLLVIGILGEYVGRIYEESKRRPLYITAQEINLEERPPAPVSRAVNPF